MERLVYKDNGYIQIKGYENKTCYELCESFDSNCNKCVMQKVIELVADYQNTNLTPEQIEKLKTRHNKLLNDRRKLKKEMLKMMNYSWYDKEDEEQ